MGGITAPNDAAGNPNGNVTPPTSKPITAITPPTTDATIKTLGVIELKQWLDQLAKDLADLQAKLEALQGNATGQKESLETEAQRQGGRLHTLIDDLSKRGFIGSQDAKNAKDALSRAQENMSAAVVCPLWDVPLIT